MDVSDVARERSSAPSTHPLADVRRRHGWSYQDLARVIADHARELGVPMAARREKVWRWEHWGVVPEPDSQRALARALGVPPREIELRPWPRWLPAHGGLPDGLPWTAEGGRTALVALLDDAGDPCGFPVAEGGVLRDAIKDWDEATWPAQAVTAPLSGMVPVAGSGPARVPEQAGAPGAVDAGVLDWLEAGALGLRRLDDRLGGAAVRDRVAADLRLVCGLLERRQSRPVERRLLRVGADLAQLGGWAATDTGRHGVAQRHYLTGLRLAHAAGDRGLAVALWGGLTLQALFSGHPQDAVDAAEAAVRAAGGAPPAVRALAASRLARAHAALGAAGAFRRAAAEAERRLAAAENDPGPSWLYWMDGAELAAQNGQSLLDLGEPREAGPLLEAALAAQDPVYVRDRALYSARAARARALTGDVDDARVMGREAARLGRHCGSPRLARELEALRPLLGAAR